ncbi:MFS transporter [Streptomyces sp. NPDC048644]|uniref:MFS transporter n=1 Tax=Streptomyces sp. NPDC048644 TaxID=3365582 RepID=UPI003710C82C
MPPRIQQQTLFTRPMVAVLLCTLNGFAGFYLLLSTVPEYAAQTSGHTAVAGIITGALMASTAELAPAGRRSQGTGWNGVATGLGGTVGTPFGVLLAHRFGYQPLFVAGTVAPLCGLLAALFIVAPRPAPVVRPRVVTGIVRPAILRPFILLTAGAMASGAVVTFLPLAAPREPLWLTPVALLLFQLGITGSRWLAGRLGDRFGNRALLLPATLTTAVGVLGATLTGDSATLLILMLVFGAGFGTLQNATLVLMLQRAGRKGFSVAGAQWNLAFDAGLGLGGFCVGIVVQSTSYSIGFAVVSGLLLMVSCIALRDVRAGGEAEGEEK